MRQPRSRTEPPAPSVTRAMMTCFLPRGVQLALAIFEQKKLPHSRAGVFSTFQAFLFGSFRQEPHRKAARKMDEYPPAAKPISSGRMKSFSESESRRPRTWRLMPVSFCPHRLSHLSPHDAASRVCAAQSYSLPARFAQKVRLFFLSRSDSRRPSSTRTACVSFGWKK